MDYEMIYNVLGVLIFVLIVYKVMKSDVGKQIRDAKEKKEEILDGYRKHLKDELELLKDDKKAQTIKKMELLKKYSEELSRNIFLEEDDIKEIISELSHF